MVYVIEVNPRLSYRAFRLQSHWHLFGLGSGQSNDGQKLSELGFTKEIIPPYFSVKSAVFPLVKFPGVDPILGPEMKSTGEVMGVAKPLAKPSTNPSFGAGAVLPTSGVAFVSVRDADKRRGGGGQRLGRAGL